MPVMIATRLPLTLGHHMSHLGAMTMTTTAANSNWSSNLPEPSATIPLKKHHSGTVHHATAAVPKAILSKEAAAAVKETLRRQNTPTVTPQPVTLAKELPTKLTTTDAQDPAWGIFQNRETFLDMHIC